MASQTATYDFQRAEGEGDVYTGGAASRSLELAFKRALYELNVAIKARISTTDDNSKFQAFSAKNIVNQLTTRDIQVQDLPFRCRDRQQQL